MKLRLDSSKDAPDIPGGVLTDQHTSWNTAVSPGFDEWNALIARSELSYVQDGGTEAASGNGENEIIFSPTVFGFPFGSSTLAVTFTNRAPVNGVRITEADVLFNTAYTWDSYRGSLRNGVVDIRRVFLHELGHVLGLTHPDQATPVQNLSAVMNSRVSSIYQLQPDDAAGAEYLYNPSLQQPTITASKKTLNLVEGDDAGHYNLQSFAINGGTPPGESNILKYSWHQRPAGHTARYWMIAGEDYPLRSAQMQDNGDFLVAVETPHGESFATVASLNVTEAPKSAATRLDNISTRGLAGTGDRALIAGFVITGSGTRRVLIRAVGPTLASAFNVQGAVTDPVLTIYDSSSTAIASNDDWDADGGGANLASAFDEAGAFELESGSADAAVVVPLPAGAYTATVTSNSGVEGVALVEAFDLDGDAVDGRFANLSTRGYVGGGENILIAGFVVSGDGPRQYLLRGLGDALGNAGVEGFLDDTTLQIYSSTGELLRETDDKDAPEFFESTLEQESLNLGAIDFADRQESGLLLTLNPGLYTLHLRGFDDSTGIALVEIYEKGVE